MVKFEESVIGKQDHFFVEEDPARIYHDLKDILVDEFDMDRIEEGHMEFNVKKPKDRIRMHAFKEKSIHTVIHYDLSWKAKSPRDIYKWDRDSEILKTRVQTSGEIISVYPGGEPINWLPRSVGSDPNRKIGHSGLAPEQRSRFAHSKLYEILAGIWHNKLNSKAIDRYQEEAEETAVRIHNLMREKFGVEKTVARTGASQYKPPRK